MSEPEHLSQAERLIAECKNRIARQREVIANAFLERSRHRGACIFAASIGASPSSLRDAPPTHP
jgi:hypothetical protein